MILVISHPDDVHAQAVGAALDAVGAAWRVLDLSLFPTKARLRIDYSTRGERFVLEWPDGAIDLDDVTLAPLIFQEFIEGRDDLRITIVGDRIFPCAINATETAYPVDFRMNVGDAAMQATCLPAAVEQRLLELMRRLGIVYGAVDMRRTPNGEYFFLEVNPAGQWLFVEQRTQQPIAAALAEALAIRDFGARANRGVPRRFHASTAPRQAVGSR